jgi:hypothetical protein
VRIFLLILLLGNADIVLAQDFDVYCKKNVKGKVSVKKKKNICWCVEENMRSQLTAEDRAWLWQQGVNKYDRQSASTETNDIVKRRIRAVEFQVFKNCSTNHKWKMNADDLGVPDDITTP